MRECRATGLAALAVENTCDQEFFWLAKVASKVGYAVAWLRAPAESLIPDSARDAQETAVQVALLRDTFANPFRPVTFSPLWRTGTAIALARQMYESRDFSAMPILADALQDAGCDNDDILTHCRGTSAMHMRGCWVVDLVLCKQ
jgi:hypothetical protein